MRWPLLALAVISMLTVCAPAQTPIDVQPVKKLLPTDTLATCSYRPISAEAPFYSRLTEKERTNDTVFGSNYTIHGKTGTNVAWFGIVRGIASPAALGGEVTLLVQHHFFEE